MDESEMQPEKDKRAEGRSNVFLAAALDFAGASVPVRIRNLSANGALVEGAAFPPIGSAVLLLRGSLSAAGTLAWLANDHAGINFGGRIDVQSWIRRAGHSGQQRVDGLITAIRGGGGIDHLPDSPPSASLQSISVALEELCRRLSSSDVFPLELGEDLMKLELIAKSLRDLASRTG